MKRIALYVLCLMGVLFLCACQVEPAPVRATDTTPAPTVETKYDITVNGNEYTCKNYYWTGDHDEIVLTGCRGYVGRKVVIKPVASFQVEEITTTSP